MKVIEVYEKRQVNLKVGSQCRYSGKSAFSLAQPRTGSSSVVY